MVRAMLRVDNMPRAANAMPYMFAKLYETKIVVASRITGTVVDMPPRAKPRIMLTASPFSQPSANSLTGLWVGPVMYSVKRPMARPARRPHSTATKAPQLVAWAAHQAGLSESQVKLRSSTLSLSWMQNLLGSMVIEANAIRGVVSKVDAYSCNLSWIKTRSPVMTR